MDAMDLPLFWRMITGNGLLKSIIAQAVGIVTDFVPEGIPRLRCAAGSRSTSVFAERINIGIGSSLSIKYTPGKRRQNSRGPDYP